MKSKKASEMDNFQSASGALDASTKIYAYRVDSVHSDTLKLAGGVGDTNKENKNNGDGGKIFYFDCIDKLTGASEGGGRGAAAPPSFLRFLPIFLEISPQKH